MDTIDKMDFGAELSNFTTKQSVAHKNKKQLLATFENRKGF